MKANELRNGNLLNPIVNRVVLDEEIHIVEPTTMMMIQGFIDDKGIKFNPIPITYDWLVRFGFIEYDSMGNLKFFNYKTNLGNRYWNICLEKNICSVSFHGLDWEDSFKVEFVHELQNLWFALTKYELELNL